MSKTTIFASSTCYDLSAHREDLRRIIARLGHESLLSEYPSFPVDPNEAAIANCKQNIAKRTDIFVLIIGGRRGSIDEASGKSVTNLEYEEARRSGIPCFAFVKRSILDLLHVWKKSPSADFSPSVDSPDVFRFIEKIQSENRWIFTFETLAEIEEHLGFQLSVALRDLLTRARSGTLDPFGNYANESAEAQRLAREKPRFWEHLLTAELLSTKLSEVRRQYNRIATGLAFSPTNPIAGAEFIRWSSAKTKDIMRLAEALQGQLDVIQESWGPSGEPGDAARIQESVEEFAELCAHLVEWERAMRGIAPPGAMWPIRDAMTGWTEGILKEMERLPDEMLRPFKDNPEPRGTYLIRLHIKLPPTEKHSEEMDKLMERMRSNPAAFLS